MSSTIEVLDSSSESGSDEKNSECKNVCNSDEEDYEEESNDLEGIFLMGEVRDMSTETLVNLFSNLLKDEDSGHTVGTSLANIANELHTFNHNFKKYVHHISKK